jgi:hypothetical protein
MGHLSLGTVCQLGKDEVMECLSAGAKMDYLLLCKLVLATLRARADSSESAAASTTVRPEPPVLSGQVTGKPVSVACGRAAVVGGGGGAFAATLGDQMPLQRRRDLGFAEKNGLSPSQTMYGTCVTLKEQVDIIRRLSKSKRVAGKGRTAGCSSSVGGQEPEVLPTSVSIIVSTLVSHRGSHPHR